MLALECKGTVSIEWWVDVAFVVHHNMKIHTGGMMYMVRGARYFASNKQKLDKKNSTEGELVGVDDLMTHLLWMQYFLEAQGMKISDDIVYQDN